jgi:hypothetical protein
MSNQAPFVLPLIAFGGPEYLAEMGAAAMALKSRRDRLRVVDGDRRMLADRTPRRAVDLKIIKGKNQP